MSLTSYLTKVKKLWNELFCLAPSPKCTCGGCTCGISKAIGEMNNGTQLTQFLMGLHENFDKERSQLLMMDPLPDLEKAFSMMFAVEQQRNIQTQLVDSNTNATFQVSLRDNRGKPKQMQKPRIFGDRDKQTMVRTHCHKQGHLKDTCFQIHGMPDWYKSLSERKKQTGATYDFAANLDTKTENKLEISSAKGDSHVDIASMMAELLKLMKGKEPSSDPISSFVNFVHCEEEFARNTLASSSLVYDDWIIDTSATNHVCVHLSNFDSYSAPAHTHFVYLPDGTKREVAYVGVVKLTDEITLKLLFYIPNFSVNLLSVSETSRLLFTVSDSHATAIFDLVHLDVWGPYKTSSLTGSNYVLTILDDYSRSLWTYLIKHKDHVVGTLQTFTALVETQYGTKIKVIRSDNGSEFSIALSSFIASSLLGRVYTCSDNGIYLAQTKYIIDIIADTGLLDAKAIPTPLLVRLKLSSETGPMLPKSESYRQLIGRLLYLSYTRPDISYSVQQLSQYLNKLCADHWKAALHVKQSTVSRSSAEVEYRSLAATVCELRWLSFLLADFGISVTLPISLFCDNKAAVHILANPVFHERTKHIEIDCHVARDAFKDGFISPVLV
ncbi:UNVERIFIED_CONTAM: Retrovirus-related Pol polyprotein from transposon RE2 [Sesamum indicum]